MTFDDLEAHIEEQLNEQIETGMIALKDGLVRRWPVDTGESQAGWKQIETPTGYAVVNHVVADPEPGQFGDTEYVPGLWYPYDNSGGKNNITGSKNFGAPYDSGEEIFDKWVPQFSYHLSQTKL